MLLKVSEENLNSKVRVKPTSVLMHYFIYYLINILCTINIINYLRGILFNAAVQLLCYSLSNRQLL